MRDDCEVSKMFGMPASKLVDDLGVSKVAKDEVARGNARSAPTNLWPMCHGSLVKGQQIQQVCMP
jgi:hypothetical protein